VDRAVAMSGKVDEKGYRKGRLGTKTFEGHKHVEHKMKEEIIELKSYITDLQLELLDLRSSKTKTELKLLDAQADIKTYMKYTRDQEDAYADLLKDYEKLQSEFREASGRLDLVASNQKDIEQTTKRIDATVNSLSNKFK
jgi:chromosome segregation ATPase